MQPDILLPRPGETPREQRERRAMDSKGGGGTVLGAAISSEWLIPQGIRQFQRSRSNAVDPNFGGFHSLPKEVQNELSEGIPPEWGKYLGRAHSLDHLRVISDQLRTSARNEAILADAGVLGFAARIGAAVTDPTLLATGFAAGALGKGVKLAGTATKLSRMQRLTQQGFVRGAVFGGASEGVIETTLGINNPTRGANDVFFAMVGGSVLGGAGGALGRKMRIRREKVMTRALRDAEYAEFQRVVEGAQGGELTDAGRKYFAEQINPETGNKFLDDVIEGLGYDADELAELAAARARGDLDFVAGYMGKLDDNVLDGGGSYAMSPANAMGSASAASFRVMSARLPKWLKNAPETAKKWLSREIDDEAAVKAAGGGDEALTELEAVRKAALEEVGEQPEKIAGDLDLLGTINASVRRGLDRVRFSIAGSVNRAKSVDFRGAMRSLIQDAVPRADGSVQGATVSEWSSRQFRARWGAWSRVFEMHYSRWLEGENTTLGARAQGRTRAEFSTLVSTATRAGGSQNAAVNAMSTFTGAWNSDMLAMAQRHGLMLDIDANDLYMTRLPTASKARDIIKKFGDDETEVINMIAGAIGAKQQISKKRALNAARAYLHTILDKDLTSIEAQSFALGHASREKTVKRLFAKQAQLGMTDEQINSAAAILTQPTKKTKGGKLTAREKARIRLDENYVHIAANGEKVAFAELLENDARRLTQLYAKQISGAAGMNEWLRALSHEHYLKVPKGFESVATAREFLERSAKDAGDDHVARMKEFDIAHDAIMGRRMTSDSGLAKASRVAMLSNHIRLSGSFGIAQLPEFGTMVATVGWRAALQTMPGLNHMLETAKRGEWSDDLMAEVDLFIGAASNYRNHQVIPHMNMAETFGEGAGAGGFEDVMRQASRIADMASGAGPITELQKRFMAEAGARKLANVAWGRGKLGKSRRQMIGLSEEMEARVVAQIKKHSKSEEGLLGKKLRKLGLNEWDDVGAANAVINGIDRWSSNAVQTADIGNLHPWMTNDWGRVIMQFRTFTTVAWEKQMLRRVANPLDPQVYAEASAGMVIAGMAYVGQTYARSIGREDREEYLAKALTPEMVGKAAFVRGGFSSLLPAVIDTGAYAMGQDNVFNDFRNTGLKADAIFGNPTADAFSRIQNFSNAALGDAFGGDEFTDQDARNAAKLLPGSRLLFLEQAYTMISEQFPDKE